MSIKTEVIDVTPAMAAGWLENNPHNRSLKEGTTRTYARFMTLGDWLPNGEAFKISENGDLLDGQHRAAAIVLSGVTLRDQIVVTGLPQRSQDTMDSGRKRTAADAFKLAGEVNWNILASVTRRAWQWETGNTKFNNTPVPSTLELKAFKDAHPLLVRSAEVGTQTNNAYRSANATVTGTAHFIFHQIDEEAAALFFARLRTGAELSENDPILTLRNRLTRDRDISRAVPFHGSVVYYIRAWNAMREGRPLTAILPSKDDSMIRPL